MKGWHNDPYKHGLASKGIKISFGKSKVRELQRELEKDVDEPIKPPKELRHPKDIRNIIQLFWWSNIHNNYNWFSFDRAFRLAEDIFRQKLGKHFKLPDDKQMEWIEKNPYEFIRLFEVHYSKGNLSQEQFEYIMNKIDEEWRKEQQKMGKKNISTLKEYLISTTVMDESDDFDVPYMMISRILNVIIDDMEMKDPLIEGITEINMFDDSTYRYIRNKYDKFNEIDDMSIEEKVIFFDELIDTYHHYGRVFDEYVEIEMLREEFEEEYL